MYGPLNASIFAGSVEGQWALDIPLKFIYIFVNVCDIRNGGSIAKTMAGNKGMNNNLPTHFVFLIAQLPLFIAIVMLQLSTTFHYS